MRPRNRRVVDIEVLAQASVDSVIRARHLRELGVSSDMIVRRCAPGGPWQRILPGVVLLHNGRPTPSQRNQAALSYAGPEAVLTGHAGLGVHGLPDSASMREVHVLVPHRRQPSSSGFVVVERSTRIPDPIGKSGLRVAPGTRCAVDAARRSHRSSECRSLLTRAIQRGLTSPAQLAVELGECSKRGTALVRATVKELTADAHSVAELAAQRLYRTFRLPTMEHNIDIVDATGKFVARPDGWIDELAVAWEIDSLGHHLSIADHERTLERRARMERLGIIVVAHLPRQIQHDQQTVLADLRAAVARATLRPRPPVTGRRRD
ncbi:hypothetical protein APR11_001137 [Nocardia amikacinitolerans]|nr:hypothetical protein [Nocardia amikacinitolerans]